MPGETARNASRLSLADALLGGHDSLFLVGSGSGLGLFLRGFLLIGLWGFIAHNVSFILVVDSPSVCKFSEGGGIMGGEAIVVNDRRQFISAPEIGDPSPAAKSPAGKFP